jgi:hypothetical protein
MSIITERICKAFEQRIAKKIDNSETDGTSLWLFGNKIAEWREDGIWITNAGWQSKTTKERLNGLTGVSIQQRAGSWYINGNFWGGEWTSVNENNGIRPTPPVVVQFDITSKWIASGKYSRPIYAVMHKHTERELFKAEMLLNTNDIKFRIIENDTDGEYKPNYFIVVRPQDYDLALSIINQ